MSIDITPAQAVLLRDMVSTRLSNLSSEIRHTDNAEFRQGLRDERDQLRALLAALDPAVAA